MKKATLQDARSNKDILSQMHQGAVTLTEKHTNTDLGKVRVSPELAYGNMVKSLTNWRWWMLVSIFLNLGAGSFSWAAATGIIALMSLIFSDVVGMFVIYASIMFWAAVSNILFSGDVSWLVLALIQLAAGVGAIRSYRMYRITKREYETLHPTKDPAIARNREARFAWLSLVLGAVGMAGVCLFSLAVVISIASPNPDAFWTSSTGALIGQGVDFTLLLGFLGFPVGLAAMLAGYQPKLAAIGGIALGALSILMIVVLLILASFA